MTIEEMDRLVNEELTDGIIAYFYDHERRNKK